VTSIVRPVSQADASEVRKSAQPRRVSGGRKRETVLKLKPARFGDVTDLPDRKVWDAFQRPLVIIETQRLTGTAPSEGPRVWTK